MIDQPIDSDGEIVEDILPERPDESAVPVELTIQPWHRPRKQFIREHQWTHYARRLVQREWGKPGLQLPHGKPELRYLNLPGIDYLDARLIGNVCRELGCQLTATGFIAGGERNPEIARAKMREEALIKSGYLSDRSHTIPRRFEELADVDGQTYQFIKRRGSFHIVNVDACGSIARPTAHHGRRIIDALHRIVTLQFRQHPGAWLLFVTTDAQPESVATKTLDRLWQAVEKNAADDGEFQEVVHAMFEYPGHAPLTKLPASVAKPGQEFLQLFSLGLGKWILHLANKQRWSMKAHSAYCYSTTPEGDETPTMACLAYEFRPYPPDHEDPFGVVHAGLHANQPDDALSQSLRIAAKVSEIDNLDAKMRNEDLRDEMAESTKSLLGEAGYPGELLKQVN